LNPSSSPAFHFPRTSFFKFVRPLFLDTVYKIFSHFDFFSIFFFPPWPRKVPPVSHFGRPLHSLPPAARFPLFACGPEETPSLSSPPDHTIPTLSAEKKPLVPRNYTLLSPSSFGPLFFWQLSHHFILEASSKIKSTPFLCSLSNKPGSPPPASDTVSHRLLPGHRLLAPASWGTGSLFTETVMRDLKIAFPLRKVFLDIQGVHQMFPVFPQ